MKQYHVFYIANNEQRVFKTRANSKKEAFAIFRKSIYGRNKVVDIVNHTAEVKQTLVVSIASIVIMLAIAFSFLAVIASWEDPQPVDYIEYIVEPGDTLWSIACLSNMWNKIDTSIIIEDMKEASNCTEVICPGQVVYIPIYGK